MRGFGVSVGALLALAPGLAFAEAPAVDDATDVDAVIVTGTRVTGLRASDSPAPIQVIDAVALERPGRRI